MFPYKYLPIHPLLRDYVSVIAIMHVDFERDALSNKYDFPWMNNAHLFFPLCDEPLIVKTAEDVVVRSYTSAYFVGPKLLNEKIDFGKERHVIGVIFKPGVLQRFLGIPGKELINIDADAECIFGKCIYETKQRVREAKNDKEIHVIVEQFLLKTVRDVKAFGSFDAAMQTLVACTGNLTVDQLAKLIYKSPRQLERMSLELLGMPPKLFARLTRFGFAFALKEMRHNYSWGQIATTVGYYDQMHLIKDFKLFMGHIPSTLKLSDDSSLKMISGLLGYKK